ncbi:MAG: phosphate/phosphite/phosphonate ABC transporter substrate-binding protein [Proteobacteria bacterium]|nr:phosphate/phosphite/phosphonate ABC transporter substrate-binding protein [Pseudomonadota bacterium]
MIRMARARIVGVAIAALAIGQITSARAADKLHFAVGPLLPTASETTKAWDPFFKHLAAKLDAPYDLVATTDWAGVAVALANSQIDVAWMGPWGYILANDDSGAQAIATAKYDGKPIYYAIVIARPDLKVATWPDDGKGLRMAFADAGSTSGWLIPTWWFKSRGIDPRTYFKYRDGNTHAANEIAVANGQTDFATDFDRNRNSMIERGAIAADATKIVWTSDPLPNDAIAVRKGFNPALAKRIQDILVAIDADTAKAILPTHYTGFVAATHDSYKLIEQAGVTVGRLKPR